MVEAEVQKERWHCRSPHFTDFVLADSGEAASIQMQDRYIRLRHRHGGSGRRGAILTFLPLWVSSNIGAFEAGLVCMNRSILRCPDRMTLGLAGVACRLAPHGFALSSFTKQVEPAADAVREWSVKSCDCSFALGLARILTRYE